MSALNKFCTFQPNKAATLTFLELTPALLSEYLQWLTQTEELSEGTIDFYLRTFKAMYNKGIKEFHLRPDFGNPFEGTTIKDFNKAVRKEEIKCLHLALNFFIDLTEDTDDSGKSEVEGIEDAMAGRFLV